MSTVIHILDVIPDPTFTTVGQIDFWNAAQSTSLAMQYDAGGYLTVGGNILPVIGGSPTTGVIPFYSATAGVLSFSSSFYYNAGIVFMDTLSVTNGASAQAYYVIGTGVGLLLNNAGLGIYWGISNQGFTGTLAAAISGGKNVGGGIIY